MNLLKLLTIFMVGALIYLYRNQMPDSGWIAGSCAIVFVLGLWLPTGGYSPAFALTTSYLLTPLIAYPLIWLGIHLPFQRIGASNDYSYGVYIYAYPVTVLLATWHVARLGEPVFVFLCVVATLPFAIASWWLVEKRALRLKTLGPRQLVQRASDPSPTDSTPARSSTCRYQRRRRWAQARVLSLGIQVLFLGSGLVGECSNQSSSATR